MYDMNAVAVDTKAATSHTNVATLEANVATFDINLIGWLGERRFVRHDCAHTQHERSDTRIERGSA